MTERFHTIDGETLMSQTLAPIRFVVGGLLSQGLHLLAGTPKSSKRWRKRQSADSAFALSADIPCRLAAILKCPYGIAAKPGVFLFKF